MKIIKYFGKGCKFLTVSLNKDFIPVLKYCDNKYNRNHHEGNCNKNNCPIIDILKKPTDI